MAKKLSPIENWKYSKKKLENKILSKEEYLLLLESCKSGGATREQTLNLIAKYEEARLSETLLTMLKAGQIKIYNWDDSDEACYGLNDIADSVFESE